MEFEKLDINEINEARRKAIKQSIHAVGLDELKALGETLFPFQDNPWRETYFQFLKDNSASVFYRATTQDGIGIIYCHANENGMWFMPEKGMGPLQAKGLRILKEIVEEAKK